MRAKVCVCVCVSEKPEEDVESSGAEATALFVLPDTGRHTEIFRKTSMCP